MPELELNHVIVRDPWILAIYSLPCIFLFYGDSVLPVLNIA